MVFNVKNEKNFKIMKSLNSLQIELLLFSDLFLLPQKQFIPQLDKTTNINEEFTSLQEVTDLKLDFTTSKGASFLIDNISVAQKINLVLSRTRIQKYLIEVIKLQDNSFDINLKQVKSGKFSFLVKKYGVLGSFILRIKPGIVNTFKVRIRPITFNSYTLLVDSKINDLDFETFFNFCLSKKITNIIFSGFDEQLKSKKLNSYNSYSDIFKFFFFSSYFGKRFLTCLMKNGKRQKAEKLFRRFFVFFCRQKNNISFFDMLQQALQNTLPLFEIREIETPGIKQTSPTIVPIYSKKRRLFLFFKLLFNFIKLKKKYIVNTLISCFLSAAKGEGEFFDYMTLRYLDLLQKQGPITNFRW